MLRAVAFGLPLNEESFVLFVAILNIVFRSHDWIAKSRLEQVCAVPAQAARRSDAGTAQAALQNYRNLLAAMNLSEEEITGRLRTIADE